MGRRKSLAPIPTITYQDFYELSVNRKMKLGEIANHYGVSVSYIDKLKAKLKKEHGRMEEEPDGDMYLARFLKAHGVSKAEIDKRLGRG